MGANSNGNKERHTKSGITIITSGTKLTGNINLDGVLHLDGHLEGNLTSDSDVSIGKQGFVRGNITADKVYVNGRVEGDIISKSCDLLAGGTVLGKVKCNSLAIQATGSLHGESDI